MRDVHLYALRFIENEAMVDKKIYNTIGGFYELQSTDFE